MDWSNDFGERILEGESRRLCCVLQNKLFFLSMVKSILVIKSSRSFRNLSYSSAEFCMSLIRLFMMSSKVMRSEGIFLRINFISFWDVSESMLVFVESEHVSIIGESLFWFPRCFGDRISFPFHVVLITSSSFSVIDYRVYFIDFLRSLHSPTYSARSPHGLIGLRTDSEQSEQIFSSHFTCVNVLGVRMESE